MKKIIPIFLSLVLMITLTTPCFALNSETATVKATYMKSEKGIFKSKIKDNRAKIILPEGTEIEVEGNLKEELFLVVIPIQKKDENAYSWFESVLKDYGTNIYPFDIYFDDEQGNKINVNGELKITISIKNEYKEPIICYTDTYGKTTVIDSFKDGNKISFTTNHNSFYSIVEKKAEITTPIEFVKQKLEKTPKTEDSRNRIIGILLLLSVSGAVFLKKKI